MACRDLGVVDREGDHFTGGVRIDNLIRDFRNSGRQISPRELNNEPIRRGTRHVLSVNCDDKEKVGCASEQVCDRRCGLISNFRCVDGMASNGAAVEGVADYAGVGAWIPLQRHAGSRACN